VLAVDCMGGDHGPSSHAAGLSRLSRPTPRPIWCWSARPTCLAAARGWPRTTLVTATEVVAMDDPVEVALRRKRDSSMRVAISS
jgi:glycerol-3-phosphate acyltransferase PlsX